MQDTKDIKTKLALTSDNYTNRTFETRLLFIESVFSERYTEEDIFKNCVEYKLRISYEQYEAEVNKCLKQMISLANDDVVRAVKKIQLRRPM